jgi:hypothetical protein
LAPTREWEGNSVGVTICDPEGMVRSKFRRTLFLEIVNRAGRICEDLRTIHGKVRYWIISLLHLTDKALRRRLTTI